MGFNTERECNTCLVKGMRVTYTMPLHNSLLKLEFFFFKRKGSNLDCYTQNCLPSTFMRRIWVIMTLHNLLSFVAVYNVLRGAGAAIIPTPCFIFDVLWISHSLSHLFSLLYASLKFQLTLSKSDFLFLFALKLPLWSHN